MTDPHYDDPKPVPTKYINVSGPNQDFRKALLSRYIKGMLAGYGGWILGGALVLNLLMHHGLFNWISERLGLYRHMTVVIFALSIDFFAVVLVLTAHSVYQRFKEGGMYRDLQLAAVTPWEAVRPLAWIVFWAVVIDTLIESTFAGFLIFDPMPVKITGFVVNLTYGLAAAFFLSQAILLFCLYNLPRTIQILLIIVLTFALLLFVSYVSDNWDTTMRRWSLSEDWREPIAEILTGGKQHHSVYISYYVTLFLASIWITIAGAILHTWARSAVPRVYRDSRKGEISQRAD